MQYYFAYGSNLHHAQMKRRCPKCKYIKKYILKGYQLTFAIAYIRDLLSQYYMIGETFETSVPWNNIKEVCHSVEYTLQEETKYLNSKPFLSYRIISFPKYNASSITVEE